MTDLADELRRYYDQLVETVSIRRPATARSSRKGPLIARRFAAPAIVVVIGLVVVFITVVSQGGAPTSTAAAAAACDQTQLMASLPDASPNPLSGAGAQGQAVSGALVPGYYSDPAGTMIIVGLKNISSVACSLSATAVVTLSTNDKLTRTAEADETIGAADGPAPPPTDIEPGGSGFLVVYIGAHEGACSQSVSELAEQLSINLGDGPISVPITRNLATGQTCTLQVEGLTAGSSVTAPAITAN